MGSFITLTTDFGMNDGYVAAMKAVIYSINPEAVIVDLCHNIQPQNIRQAAFVLNTAAPFFPAYTVHLIVVDPGVGTDRRAVILKTPSAHFVAPDNGLLSYILEPFHPEPLPDLPRVKLSSPLRGFAITRSEYWRKPVSRTFHGRDIFAPVAARLSLGTVASALGDEIDTLSVIPLAVTVSGEGSITGHIVHIDNFGNLITDIHQRVLPSAAQSITIKAAGAVIQGLAGTYAEGRGPVALLGSSGYLEIAVNRGSAAAFLRADIGDEVLVVTGTDN
ncbi:MAG: SAM-dependent chlorinase/fluorinase [Dehalococcoidales bacterium]|nr:SAM-dependent chlorinase/fluorinase [Dehalococcoidales bacterium]